MKQNKEIGIKLLADCQQHIPYLAQLWYEQIGKEWVTNANIEDAKQKFTLHANTNQLPMTFVATHNDQPIGMASLRANDGLQSLFTPWLGALIVDPNYRQQKIGEQLINTIKQQAFIFGHKKLYLLAFDPTIPHWYKKLGWEPIGTDKLCGHPVAVMSINLLSDS
jgi:N-acetylglutamate synthase-like GNAT family acetyltransferase